MKFELTPEEEKQVEKWKKKQQKKKADSFALGERWTYSFTPTGMGVITVIHDNLLDEELDLTDYNW
jgi:hypothetical protein